MQNTENIPKNGSTVTRLTLVVLFHVGIIAGFVGCAKQARVIASEPTPVEARIVSEIKPQLIHETPPAPPPPAEMIVPKHAAAPMATIASASTVMPLNAPVTAKFSGKEANPAALVADKPVSTFSIDVDTAAYSFVRRSLTEGTIPPSEAVRVEEMLNYFPYEYASPANPAEPIAVATEVMPNPWNADTQLVHIAIKGYEVPVAQRPPVNVVLLIDTSGSMFPEDRLPLLKKSFRLFAEQLRDQDRVSIVTYASGTAVLLEPTPGSRKPQIMAAIDDLGAGGGTAGGEGLERAYAMARKNFDPKAVNRVILASDGDFNIGISDPKQLEMFIANKRKTGVYLSILGVGQDNLNDALIQRLTQAGNGNAAYIDTLPEARKALSGDLGSTMFPIANDVKVQVEFNPRTVAAYRLVGYETRMLERQDFTNDKVDAGDMGAGHSVTAIYEITPVGAAGGKVAPLRYAKAGPPAVATTDGQSGKDELCFVKLRYKLPGESVSREMAHAVHASSAHKSIDAVPGEQRFAVAVAAFGQRLRAEKDLSDFSYAQIAKLAESGRGADPQGYRAEFVRLVRTAGTLSR